VNHIPLEQECSQFLTAFSFSTETSSGKCAATDQPALNIVAAASATTRICRAVTIQSLAEYCSRLNRSSQDRDAFAEHTMLLLNVEAGSELLDS
jgi:hypothetical protein